MVVIVVPVPSRRLGILGGLELLLLFWIGTVSAIPNRRSGLGLLVGPSSVLVVIASTAVVVATILSTIVLVRRRVAGLPRRWVRRRCRFRHGCEKVDF